jgi:hypothetical protein
LSLNGKLLKYVIKFKKNKIETFEYDYIKIALNNITNRYLFNAWMRVLIRLYPSKIKELFYILSKEHTVILALNNFLVGDLVNIIFCLYFTDGCYSNKTIKRFFSTFANTVKYIL